MFNTLLPIALLFLTGLESVRAVPPGAYLGCANSQINLGSYATVDGVFSAPDCASRCYNDQGSTYSYYRPAQSIPPPRKRDGLQEDYSLFKREDPGSCYCTETPPAQYFTASEATDGTGTCPTTAYTVFVTTTTYTFTGCYSGLGPNTSPTTLTPVAAADPEGCLRACVSFPGVLMGYGEAGLQCYCTPQDAQFTNPSQCTAGRFFIYTHPAGTSVNSQFAKRQLRERLVMEKNSKRGVCPTPLTACKVNNVLESFECINTNEELESCGGCISGDFNDLNASVGVDCTTLPGVAKGGVTCSAGRCEAFACKIGFTLTNEGTCVAL
ncbi:hypothetical protein CI109_105472 [Kwoniella shandongensis]|uniref:Uncharacterized protein n=1 Tax=Kwoniella shandongensis TaxID=1734106 RepID=A0A5M6C3N7_9TREE|nr:uncharacterized protein CI109_002193 [Kwoniella shandongensis]KAA5529300.1 hypothetical protein CI109_002193 [Kwoniella shandongensis]